MEIYMKKIELIAPCHFGLEAVLKREIIDLGYEIKEVEPAPITNETIKKQRQHAYRMRADQYLIAYQAYTELGELDKANEMKELWLKEREAIDKQYPYIEEQWNLDY